MTVQFETNFDVGPFGYHGDGTWVLANGDTTGVSPCLRTSTDGSSEYMQTL